jgi:hypothetical protein
VKEELPIDQSIFLDISGFSSEQTFFWLFEAEGDSGEDVGHNTDQAGRCERTGVSGMFRLDRLGDAHIIWMEDSACGRPKKTFNRMGINSENDPAGKR